MNEEWISKVIEKAHIYYYTVNKIYASTLKRTVQTAQYLSDAVDIQLYRSMLNMPIEIDLFLEQKQS